MCRKRCLNATRFLNFAVILSLLSAFSCARKHESSLSPKESLSRFQVDGAFRVELVAAEPLVLHPTGMVFDEDGRIYVSELVEAASDPAAPVHSRIILLQDTDGDGKPDKRTVYADGLSGASGLMPWKGGLVVMNGADILYLKDQDGDGKAEVRQVLYTGFLRTQQYAR